MVGFFMEAKQELEAHEERWRNEHPVSNGGGDGGGVDGGGGSAPLRFPPRNSSVFISHLTMHMNGGRENLPQGEPLPAREYYARMMTTQYVNSPRGDRPDCYRHWEAIGLGAIPVSNLAWYPFKPLFGSSMVFAPEFDSEDTLLGAGQPFVGKQTPQVAGQAHEIYLKMLTPGPAGDAWRPLYSPPDRSLALVAHWAAKIKVLQGSLRAGGPPLWLPTT